MRASCSRGRDARTTVPNSNGIAILTGKQPQDIEADPRTGELMWKQYVPNISPTLASFLDKAIRSHASERYNTAKEMLQTLQEETIVCSPGLPSIDPKNPQSPHTLKLGELQKTALLGSFIAVAIVIGFWITTQFPKSESQPSIVTTPSLSPVSPTPISRPIGWIRIGAVKNKSGLASIGDRLIATTQPVTIHPMVVPAVNNQVITITGVNLRKHAPQPPNYKLAEKVSVLLENQQLKILSLKTFVDSDSPSPYTVVWAEVGIP